MKVPRKEKALSRDEDYRDYEERDLREGWPYSDGSGSTSRSPENRSYGATGANFDEDRGKGFIVDERPARTVLRKIPRTMVVLCRRTASTATNSKR